MDFRIFFAAPRRSGVEEIDWGGVTGNSKSNLESLGWSGVEWIFGDFETLRLGWLGWFEVDF